MANSKAKTKAAAAKPAGGDPLGTYQVLRNIHHNGKQYEPNGQDVMTIDLTEADALPLIDAAAIAVMADE